MPSNSTFLNGVFSKGNTRLLISEEVSIEAQLRVIIEDIKSGNNTHVELDAFYDRYDYYIDLKSKKAALQHKMKGLSMEDKDYNVVAIQITEIIAEEKSMRISILDLALTLEKMRDSETILKIKEHYRNGQLKEIDKGLPENYLTETLNRYLENEQRIQQVAEKLMDNANEFQVKAQVTNLNYQLPDRFEKSVFYFEKGLMSAKATRIAPFSVWLQLDFAHFLHEHKQFSQAQPLYEEALQIRKQLAQQNPQTYLPDVAGTLNNLAMLYSDRNEFSQAQPLYEEALQIDRQLAQQTPQTYLPYVAATLNNLANLYKNRNEFSQAQPLYEEALQIYRQLAQQNPQTYLPYVAGTLNNLANLYKNRNEFSQAQPLYEEALQIRKQLSQQNLHTYLPDVAATLNNLANLYYARNEFSQALPLYEEALQIRRQLAQQNPQTYLPDVATTLNNLALLYSSRNEFSQAQPLYEEALQIDRQLAQQNPQTYLPDVATTLNNLALLYSARNEFSQAQPLYEEALQIRRQLVQQNPQTYLPDVAMTLNNLANLYSARKEFSQAQPLYEEALQIRRQLVQQNPQTYLPDVAHSLNNLAALYKARNEFSQAQPLYEEALQIYRQLVQQNPQTFMPYVANTLNNLAILYKARNEFNQAQPLYEEALQIYRQLAQQNPQTFMPYVAMTAVNLSIFYLQSIQDRSKSLAYAQEALNEARSFENDLGRAKEIMSNAKQVIARWGENHLNHEGTLSIPEFKQGPNRPQKETQSNFTPDNFREKVDGIRTKIQAGSTESALSESESFVLSFEKMPLEEKDGELDFLAEAKMLLGMCYGKRAGSTISDPESRYLTEAYELSRSLLQSGDSISELYIECAFHKIESLKKQVIGWFPSKKAKNEIHLIRYEVLSLTEGVLLTREAIPLYETIKNLKI